MEVKHVKKSKKSNVLLFNHWMVSPPPASSLARTAASNATSLTTACSRRFQFHVWFNQSSSPNPILVVEGFEPTSTKRMNRRVSDYQWLRCFSDMTRTCKVDHNMVSLPCTAVREGPDLVITIITFLESWPIVL